MLITTFSIVAYDPEQRAWGVAVASKFPAVGSVVPWARAGAGALATQSYANPAYGPQGLDLMESGLSAQEALQRILAQDAQFEQRQVGLVDASGSSATYTGSACHAWAGGLSLPGLAVQGNILAGPGVLQAMVDEFAGQSSPFHWRLHRALLAGDRAGGDRRGRQSAAIYIVKANAGYGGFNDCWVDYRVDDHPDPVIRLGELLELHDLYFSKSPPGEQVKLSGEALRALQAILARQDLYHGELHGQYDAPTRLALQEFIGNENFEERVDLDLGQIDQPVLDYLLRRHVEEG